MLARSAVVYQTLVSVLLTRRISQESRDTSHAFDEDGLGAASITESRSSDRVKCCACAALWTLCPRGHVGAAAVSDNWSMAAHDDSAARSGRRVALVGIAASAL